MIEPAGQPMGAPEAETAPRTYPGRELEAMAFAANYHRWILDLFAPHLGRSVLEVGAGTGSFSEILLASGVEHLVALEPSENMFPLLERAMERAGPARRAEARRQTLAELASDPGHPAPDTVIYLNVLEHVEDDLAELGMVRAILAAGGRLLIFVPAHEWLMSPIDRTFGHYRRYSTARLTALCRAAGFDVVSCRHFDFFGILPWWLRYRVFRSNAMEPSAVRLYDRWIVPVARALENRIPPPVGKNLLLIGRVSPA